MYEPLDLEFFSTVSQQNDEQILLIVIDGLGGLRHPSYDDKTELEYASDKGLLPHLTDFVQHSRSVTGLIYPVARGITPGSGAGHLGLFGYDPLKYRVKRGALEAAGIPNLPEHEIVARLNFARVDEKGIIVDRRAGRLGCSATRGRELADELNRHFSLKGVHATVVPTRDHRGVLLLRRVAHSASQLTDEITNTDPGAEGLPLQPCEPSGQRSAAALNTAEIVQELTSKAREILANEQDANAILLRGFAKRPDLPTFDHVFKLRPAAIALYSLYRGVAATVGMAVLNGNAQCLKDEFDLLDACEGQGFDFVYLHYKKPDAMGEDGDFLGKVEALAEFDELFPRALRGDRFSVIAITGDHSTPSVMGRHSEHSVPLVINARTMKGYDTTKRLTEGDCVHGTLGRLRGVELMPILMAKAGKLRKVGG